MVPFLVCLSVCNTNDLATKQACISLYLLLIYCIQFLTKNTSNGVIDFLFLVESMNFRAWLQVAKMISERQQQEEGEVEGGVEDNRDDSKTPVDLQVENI